MGAAGSSILGRSATALPGRLTPFASRDSGNSPPSVGAICESFVVSELNQVAAALALVQLDADPWAKLAREVRDRGGVSPVLDERGYFQEGLFGDGPPAEELIEQYTEMLHGLEERGIRAITISSAEFPSAVAQLKAPPLFLFYRGTLDTSDSSGIAIIGSRRVTDEALATARSWAGEISRRGAVVVSGLAAGIDREAHLGALGEGRRTVAVIGTGIERAYPKENAGLQEEIATRHLVVSQFLPDAPPTKTTFPMRNAVMAAWARATLVIDADERSGAALQARLAAEQGRPLFLHHKLRIQPWANKFVDAGQATFVDSPEEVLATA